MSTEYNIQGGLQGTLDALPAQAVVSRNLLTKIIGSGAKPGDINMQVTVNELIAAVIGLELTMHNAKPNQ